MLQQSFLNILCLTGIKLSERFTKQNIYNIFHLTEFEPATFPLSAGYATELRYIPNSFGLQM